MESLPIMVAMVVPMLIVMSMSIGIVVAEVAIVG